MAGFTVYFLAEVLSQYSAFYYHVAVPTFFRDRLSSVQLVNDQRWRRW